MLLIAGGEFDPNIVCLLRAARKLRRLHLPLLVGASRSPVLTWEMPTDRLWIDQKRIRPTAAFIRHDVFGNMRDERQETAYRAFAWYSTVAAYIDAHPEIRSFNRKHDGGLKPHQLHLAREVGLEVPWTLVTNDVTRLRREAKRRRLVTKPVNGGEYCQKLADVLPGTEVRGSAAPAPAIVQEELVQPDVRIFRIGTHYLSFTIAHRGLDYRTTEDAVVTQNVSIDTSIQRRLEHLTDELGLDYAAADFKADPVSGRLKFLEVNSAPMFLAFDAAAKGKLARALLDHLHDRPDRPETRRSRK